MIPSDAHDGRPLGEHVDRTPVPSRPSTASRRLPRAGVDAIVHPDTALALLHAAVSAPIRDETVVVLLDHLRRGMGLVVVSGTGDPDAAVVVVDRVLAPVVHGGTVAAAIVATVRPGRVDDELADAERWLDLDRAARRHGVELVEWFVLGDGVSRPRELLNAPPRWRPHPAPLRWSPTAGTDGVASA